MKKNLPAKNSEMVICKMNANKWRETVIQVPI